MNIWNRSFYGPLRNPDPGAAGGGATAATTTAATGEAPKANQNQDPSATIEHLNGLTKKYLNENATLKEQLKKFEGIDLAALQAAANELVEMKGKSGKPEDFEAAKKQLEDTYKTKIETLTKSATEAQAQLKTLRVTNEAMKHHSQHFVEKSEQVITDQLVSRFCDWDEKEGRIVVKDDKGQIRYSPTKAGSPMTVEELFAEYAAAHPFLAKPKQSGGTMKQDGPAGTGAKGESSSKKFVLPAHINGSDQAAVTQYFKENPEELQKYLNNGA